MKKNSAKMKLLSAAGMLGISAAMLATSTYAWFTMNTEVSVKGMKVQAKAEKGLLISNSEKATWADSATATSANAVLFPTNTVNGVNWAHATSTNADEAQPNQQNDKYTDLTDSIVWTEGGTETGVGYVDDNSNDTYDVDTDSKYVLSNIFYIKSSADALTAQNLYIKELNVTPSNTEKKIDAAMRVLLVMGQGNSAKTTIFAPVSVSGQIDTPATVKFMNKGTEVNNVKNALNTNVYANGDIGNSNETAVPVKVYLYYEGEDPNCKSTNISGIEVNDLSVEIKFGLTNT